MQDSRLSILNIVYWIEKTGKVDRIMGDNQFLLVKELSIPLHLGNPRGMKVEFENGIVGTIDSFFGQNKKLKVQINDAQLVKRDSTVKLKYKKQIHLA